MKDDTTLDLVGRLNSAFCVIRDAEARAHKAEMDKAQAMRCYGVTMAELEQRLKPSPEAQEARR